MRVQLKLNKYHIKMIPFFFIQEKNEDNEIQISKDHLFNLGNHLLEDMAMVLGFQDKMIPNTLEDAEGPAYEDEAEKIMLDTYNYICEHLTQIETLIHQFVIIGGITEGTYEAESESLIWKKIN